MSTTLNIELTVGKIYRFRFVSDFVTLGYDVSRLGSGIYRVVQILDHDEMYAIGKAKLIDTFLAVSKTKEQFAAAEAGFLPDKYFKLQSMNDEFVYYYFPESLIIEHPEVRISEYAQVMLSVDLGTFNDPTVIDTCATAINDMLAYNFGIGTLSTDNSQTILAHRTAQALGNVETVIYRTLWMGDDEYETIQADRETVRSKVLNYMSECARLTAEKAVLQSKIDALEAIIIAAQPQS